MTLANDGSTGLAPPPGVALGVIDEARRRRRRRLAGLVVAAVIVGAIAGGLAWGFGGNSDAGTRTVATVTLAAAQREARQAGFDVRLVPTLSVGYAGWCEIPEERGRADGSACGPLPAPGGPVLQSFGWGEPGRSVSVAVTEPDVASVQFGGRRVATLSLPGLPYGLRAARLVDGRPGQRFLAYDAHGKPIPEPLLGRPSKQATVRKWRRPEQPPAGVCRLGAPSGVRGLETLGGSVAQAVNAYPGTISGHAFTTCASAEYRLGGEPLGAFVLVDAAAPASFSALLPGFHAIEHGQRFFANGGLTARRYGGGWIVAGQGKNVEQRITLLEHLTATTPSA
ncbi:MAG TPA: hypothetical protein VNV44_13450 [Solirubrobacteraceae bacterium]|jgi:hypothetical protein|nr:hypothetical protein [Solirubrobacteraceae bacterium]